MISRSTCSPKRACARPSARSSLIGQRHPASRRAGRPRGRAAVLLLHGSGILVDLHAQLKALAQAGFSRDRPRSRASTARQTAAHRGLPRRRAARRHRGPGSSARNGACILAVTISGFRPRNSRPRARARAQVVVFNVAPTEVYARRPPSRGPRRRLGGASSVPWCPRSRSARQWYLLSGIWSIEPTGTSPTGLSYYKSAGVRERDAQ